MDNTFPSPSDRLVGCTPAPLRAAQCGVLARACAAALTHIAEAMADRLGADTPAGAKCEPRGAARRYARSLLWQAARTPQTMSIKNMLNDLYDPERRGINIYEDGADWRYKAFRRAAVYSELYYGGYTERMETDGSGAPAQIPPAHQTVPHGPLNEECPLCARAQAAPASAGGTVTITLAPPGPEGGWTRLTRFNSTRIELTEAEKGTSVVIFPQGVSRAIEPFARADIDACRLPHTRFSMRFQD